MSLWMMKMRSSERQKSIVSLMRGANLCVLASSSSSSWRDTRGLPANWVSNATKDDRLLLHALNNAWEVRGPINIHLSEIACTSMLLNVVELSGSFLPDVGLE